MANQRRAFILCDHQFSAQNEGGDVDKAVQLFHETAVWAEEP